MRFSTAISLLILCLLPGKFLITTLPFYGFAWASSLILYFEVALLLVCLFYAVTFYERSSFSRTFMYLLLFYFCYYLFVFYQIFAGGDLLRINMQEVPSSNVALFRDFFIQTSTMLLVGMYRNYINFNLIAKVTALVTFLLFFAYYSKVGYLSYGIFDIEDSKDLRESGLIVSFTLARHFAIAFFCYVAYKQGVQRKGPLSEIISRVIAIVLVIGLVLTIKRGPILSLLFTWIYVYLVRTSESRLVLSVILTAIMVFLFGNLALDLGEHYASGLIERFLAISHGGSSRFGSSDSVFALALKQIAESPLFGSCFRILTGRFRGGYPHNLVLELMMTFGVLLTAAFVPLFLRSIKLCKQLINAGGSQALSAMCFLYVLCSLMTSDSIFLKPDFWLFFAIICNYNLEPENESISIGNYSHLRRW